MRTITIQAEKTIVYRTEIDVDDETADKLLELNDTDVSSLDGENFLLLDRLIDDSDYYDDGQEFENIEVTEE